MPIEHWDILFRIFCWSLWCRRNNRIFNMGLSDRESLDKSMRMCNEFIKALQDKQELCNKACEKGVQPPEDWLKVNTDGARKTNTGLAAAGGVLRDHNGGWKAGFARNIGVYSIVEANLTTVELIQRSDQEESANAILREIKKMLRWNWTTNLIHTHREGNRVTDTMATIALTKDLGLYYFR
ncbi:hypothetical protein CXB51_000013 [Gossypium anomalum]|uniref:RNase H type-1 domain-containing protein n=1 Tax=Gossypium anomalum TaxID=47600 RepID=A0A8J6A210_9ROSI|nr:hypothetical protein CXB51_000013 [Gossypium anomalum]